MVAAPSSRRAVRAPNACDSASGQRRLNAASQFDLEAFVSPLLRWALL